MKQTSWSSPATRPSRWRRVFDAYPFGRSAGRDGDPIWSGYGPGMALTAAIAVVVLLIVTL